ncbi:hypothetical protein [Sporanaerobacter acetigenes]|nr:hypothetical protein [Sporanaerobacter acetigenes]
MYYYNNNILIYPKIKTMRDNGLKEYEKIENKCNRKNSSIYRKGKYF